MELLKREFWILEPFTREPWKDLTFKQVKNLSKNKSDSYVHRSLKKFVKVDVLKQKKIGNVIVYSVNNNVMAFNVMGFIAEYKANTAKHIPNIQNIINKIRTPYYSFIITGSYARNQQNKHSDLDIVIICDDKRDPRTILAEIKLESELNIPEIHPYVFKKSEFFEMLINKEENYGKETARNSLIITGAKQYYDILMEAIQDGFNG